MELRTYLSFPRVVVASLALLLLFLQVLTAPAKQLKVVNNSISKGYRVNQF